MNRPDLVALERAATPFEAKVIAAVLADAEIPAYIDGELLSDEFAAAQRLMNLRGTTIMVPAEAAGQAREALRAARAAGREIAEEADAADQTEPPTPPPLGDLDSNTGGSGLWTVLLGIGFVISTIGWIANRRTETDPLYRFEYKSNGILTILESTGEVRWSNIDMDGDGIYEELATFDRDGREIDRSFDLDGDGFYERGTSRAANGTLSQEFLDTDADGRVDQWIEPDPDPARGWRSIWTDPNGDGVPERREIQRQDGSTVLIEINRFERGFERQR